MTGRTLIVFSPGADLSDRRLAEAADQAVARDTLFQRLPQALENERRMRVEQARRDRRAEMAAFVEKGKRARRSKAAQAWTAAAGFAVIFAAILAHFQ